MEEVYIGVLRQFQPGVAQDPYRLWAYEEGRQRHFEGDILYERETLPEMNGLCLGIGGKECTLE